MPSIKGRKALIAVFGVIVAVVALASPASAAPYGSQPTCSVSDQTPGEGGSFTLSGSGFGANENISDVLHSVPSTLAPAATDASGNFAVTVALPMGFTGVHTISSTGATSGRVATVTITIGGTTTNAAAGTTAAGTTAAGTTAATGGLAFTGADVAGIGALAVLLLLGGVLMVFASRRRRSVNS
jgi:hypothetical protein